MRQFRPNLIATLAALLGLLTTASAQTTNYTYDENGRLASVEYPDGRSIHYAYDAADNLTERKISIGGPEVVLLSSASFVQPGLLAPDAIASAFGPGLAAGTGGAVSADLPEEILGTSVDIEDAAGTTHRAKLFAVTPTQINLLVPAGVAPGSAIIRVNSGAGGTVVGSVAISTVAPGIYTANQQGTGVPAGFQLYVPAVGERVQSLLADAGANAAPIDLGAAGDQVYLILFGTGMRGSTRGASATVGGFSVPLAGPVAHGVFAGLDQINLGPLPRELIAAGDVEVRVVVDGKPANVVTIHIQ